MWAEGRGERESGVVTWSRGQGARPPQVGARAAALILGRPDPWRAAGDTREGSVLPSGGGLPRGEPEGGGDRAA